MHNAIYQLHIVSCPFLSHVAIVLSIRVSIDPPVSCAGSALDKSSIQYLWIIKLMVRPHNIFSSSGAELNELLKARRYRSLSYQLPFAFGAVP